MTFYLQHGYGKGTKISNTAADGDVTGVILSPGDEDVSALTSTVSSVRALGLRPLLDPQTYIYSTTPTGSARCHSDHKLNFRNVQWSQSAREVEAQLNAVRSANLSVGIDGPFIAPTCIQSSLTDIWTPLALQYARSAADMWGSQQTIASVAIDEAALTSWRDIADWLDIVTGIDVRGFYIVVNRSTKGYPPVPWDALKLSNMLRIIYNLAVLNEYEVHWGYSDQEGLVGVASGASSISSGWHYTLRQFFTSKWQVSPPGGKPPTARVYLPAIWSTPRAEEEFKYILASKYGSQIVHSSIQSHFNATSISSWSRVDAQVQFLTEISLRSSLIASEPSISNRLDATLADLDNAVALHAKISGASIVLPPGYVGRVRTIRSAINEMRLSESI